MSSVHKNARKETDLQSLVTSQNLQIKLTKFLMSDKNLPKKYRYLLGQDLIRKADELVDNLVAANAIFPTIKSEYLKRADFQQNAIINCRQLHNRLYRMLKSLDNSKIAKLEDISALLTEAEITLKGWKKRDKDRYKELPVE